MGELDFLRPLALLALVLPAVLLLAARLFTRPPVEPTGSLCIWKELGFARGEGRAAARVRVPPTLWFCAASAACGIVATAGPRFLPAEGARTWTAVVDRSPGMVLPVSRSFERTRLALALDLARAHLATGARRGDRVRWVSPERETLDLAADELPAREWLAADAWFAPRPAFVAYDLPGALWITDRAPPAQSASVFASGGEEVPGPIGDHAGRTLVWRGGDELVEAEAPVRAIRIVGAGEDGAQLLVDMAKSYAAGRGLRVASASEPTGSDSTALTLLFGAGEPGEPGETHAVGRDGWRVEAQLRTCPAIARPPETIATWLVLPAAGMGEDRPLVRWAPGIVSIGFWPTGEPRGDPAAFAVSWASLFDAALLPRPGAAPLAAREAAGVSSTRAGEPPPEGGEGRIKKAPPPLDAWLAAAAAACAVAAAVTAVRARSGA